MDYLRSSRTIETILVSNLVNEKVFFVYNYEGYSFRVFSSHSDLINFFQDNNLDSEFHFDTENELCLFLSKVDLKN